MLFYLANNIPETNEENKTVSCRTATSTRTSLVDDRIHHTAPLYATVSLIVHLFCFLGSESNSLTCLIDNVSLLERYRFHLESAQRRHMRSSIDIRSDIQRVPRENLAIELPPCWQCSRPPPTESRSNTDTGTTLDHLLSIFRHVQNRTINNEHESLRTCLSIDTASQRRDELQSSKAFPLDHIACDESGTILR